MNKGDEMGKKTAGPTISCCMIVKNEEAFLAQCLDSVKDYVDEIIIVDTGSTDSTVEISRRYTDKVYFHPWEDSFAKARNQANSYASMEWIFSIDADEELLPGNGPKLREAVADAGDADALTVNIISIYDHGRRTARHNFGRIFRNKDSIKFVSTVHNRLVGAEKKVFTKIELMHYGYNHQAKVRNEKFHRTAGLLRKQIEEDPENPLPHHYLGASYLALAMLDECIKESLLAIELAEKQGDDNTVYLWSHYNAAFCYLGKEDVERAERIALKALDIFPDHLDSHNILTLAAAKKLDWGRVTRYGKRFLELLDFYNNNTDQAGMVVNCTLSEGSAVHMLLGHASHSCGDRQAMLGHYEAAYTLSGRKFSVWVNCADYHMGLSGDLDLARELLEKAGQEAPGEALLWVACAKLHQKTEDPLKEKECLKKVFQAGTDEIRVITRLAHLLVQSGECAEALQVLESADRLDPSDYQLLLNKARAFRQLGSLSEAVEAFSQALGCKEASADHIPWMEIGDICFSLEKPDDAEVFFDRALAVKGDFIPALLKLGEIRLLRGDIAGFVRRCDSVMSQLGMDRDKVINSMDEIAEIVLEIDSQLRKRADYPGTALEILALLPNVDYKKMLIKVRSGSAESRHESAVNYLESLISLPNRHLP